MNKEELKGQCMQIFTTGAFCEPRKYINPRTGQKTWRWIVVGFEDDSFRNGAYVNPVEVAEAREELIEEDEK